MTPDEVKALCRFAANLAPAQKWFKDTPTAWAMVLEGVPYADARAAVVQLGGTQEFISPSAIVAKVKAMRRDRLAGVDDVLPNADPDDPAGYRAEIRALVQAQGSGSLDPEVYAASGQTLSGAPALTAAADRRALPAGPGGSTQVEVGRRLALAAPRVTRRVPAVNPAVEGGDRPPAATAPTRALTDRELAAIEAERERQLAALAAMATEGVPTDA